MSNTNKAVYLLERTVDAVSNIIGFYSSEELAIVAVKRHVERTIDEAVTKSNHESDTPYTGIYIQEGFMISKNDVEVDDEVDFEKIEDPEEFPAVTSADNPDGEDLSDQDIQYPVTEDLGDVK